MQSVRHSEGTRITALRGHSSAVSVLNLAQDERSVLSGSWDKTVIDWDLNLGAPKRTFIGSSGQISAIEMRPESKLPIPEDTAWVGLTNGTANGSTTFSSNNASKPKQNGVLSNGLGGDLGSQTGAGTEDAAASPDDDMNSLFGDDDTAGIEAPSMPLGEDDEDDEFSRAITAGLQQQTEEDAEGDVDMTDEGGAVVPPSEGTATAESDATLLSAPTTQAPAATNGVTSPSAGTANPSSEGPLVPPTTVTETNGTASTQPDPTVPKSESIFLDASITGTLRIWDRRQPNPIATIKPPRGTSPWCMSACWSPDGNFIFAGRRNNAVEEYSLHKGLREPSRTFKFPNGSGPVSAVRSMPNGRGLVW